MKPRLFVFGLGYVGLRVAEEALGRGYDVAGSIRTSADAPARLQALQLAGIRACTFDLDESYCGLSAPGLESLRRATHVLATVPPVADLDRDPLLALHEQDLLAAAASGPLRWAGYLSTTSVYGDHGGAWVDETSETRGGPRTEPRLRAERGWLALGDRTGGQVRSRVFRLAGIYGLGRSALDTVTKAAAARAVSGGSPGAPVSAARGVTAAAQPPAGGATDASQPGASSGEAAAGSPPRYVSRVHVKDIARALLASMDAAQGDDRSAGGGDKAAELDPYSVYNVADDAPTPRAEVMRYAARLLGQAEGSEKEELEGTGARAGRRAQENKRVSNRRLGELLGEQGLLYPTYRDGLDVIRAHGASSGWSGAVERPERTPS
jgi:nucleoside-diphosphate-sugar epimerase